MPIYISLITLGKLQFKVSKNYEWVIFPWGWDQGLRSGQSPIIQYTGITASPCTWCQLQLYCIITSSNKVKGQVNLKSCMLLTLLLWLNKNLCSSWTLVHLCPCTCTYTTLQVFVFTISLFLLFNKSINCPLNDYTTLYHFSLLDLLNMLFSCNFTINYFL